MLSQTPETSLPKKRIKVILLGDRSVGKSSIINRFITNSFQQSLQPTVGVDFMGKNVKYKGEIYRIQLWDTAGQEKYRSLVKGYLKGADCCIFIYDCSSVKTYVNLPEWMNLFDSVSNSQCYKMIVGNKCDKQFKTQILQQSKAQIIHQNPMLKNIPQLISSAKLGINIEKIFEEIIINYAVRKNKRNQNIKFKAIVKDIKSYTGNSCCN